MDKGRGTKVHGVIMVEEEEEVMTEEGMMLAMSKTPKPTLAIWSAWKSERTKFASLVNIKPQFIKPIERFINYN